VERGAVHLLGKREGKNPIRLSPRGKREGTADRLFAGFKSMPQGEKKNRRLGMGREDKAWPLGPLKGGHYCRPWKEGGRGEKNFIRKLS